MAYDCYLVFMSTWPANKLPSWLGNTFETKQNANSTATRLSEV